jgi:flagellar biosynthetic protein FliR
MPVSDILNIINDFKCFLLIAFRIGGMVLIVPFFANRAIPRNVKVLLVIAVAVIVFPAVNHAGVHVPDNMGGYFAVAVSEMAVGAIIGFAVLLVFSAVQLGGFIADQQIGLAIAQVFNPDSGEESSLLADLLYMVALVVFIVVGGHRLVLRVLAASYDVVPLTRAEFGHGVMEKVSVGMVSQMWVNAVKISAPSVIALMLATIVMAIVARTVPEMNIFNIGFALRLGLGLVIMALSMPALGWILQMMFAKMAGDLETLLGAMRPSS